MKKYTGVWGSGDAGANGIYTEDCNEQVLDARALDKLGIELVAVIRNDWSDTAIDGLIIQNRERMASAKAAWQKAHPGLVW